MVLLELPCSNEVYKIYASINGGLLPNASELIGIQETISSHLKLKPIADDFLDEFVYSIE